LKNRKLKTMTKEEKKILESALSKLLKMDAEAMSSLYNEDGDLISMDAVIEANASKTANHKEEKENQYKRGLKEGATKFEKYIRNLGIDSESEGTDLVDELIETKLKEVSKKPELTDDDIEKHPKFIELKTETDKKIKEAIKARDAEFAKEKMEFLRKETLSKVTRKAEEMLNSLNPLLPEDQAKAEAWKKTYLKEFEGFEYQEKDGDFVVLKDGKVYEDSHGNTVKFSELAKSTADKYFEYKAADDRSNAGNKDGSTPSIIIKSREEFNNKIKEAGQDTAKRDQIIEAAQKAGIV
jgi:hypothetical protein